MATKSEKLAHPFISILRELQIEAQNTIETRTELSASRYRYNHTLSHATWNVAPVPYNARLVAAVLKGILVPSPFEVQELAAMHGLLPGKEGHAHFIALGDEYRDSYLPKTTRRIKAESKASPLKESAQDKIDRLAQTEPQTIEETKAAFLALLKAIRESRYYYAPNNLKGLSPIITEEQYQELPKIERQKARRLTAGQVDGGYSSIECGWCHTKELTDIAGYLQIDLKSGAGSTLALWHKFLEDQQQQEKSGRTVKYITRPHSEEKMDKTQAILFDRFINNYPGDKKLLTRAAGFVSFSSFIPYRKGRLSKAAYHSVIESLAPFLTIAAGEQAFTAYVNTLPNSGKNLREQQVKDKITDNQKTDLADYLAHCGVSKAKLNKAFGKLFTYFTYIVMKTYDISTDSYNQTLAMLGFSDEAAMRSRTAELKAHPEEREKEAARLLARAKEYHAEGQGEGRSGH